jgi:PUA domain protein
MKKRSLSKREIKELNSKFSFDFKLDPKSNAEIAETEKGTVIVVDSEPVLFLHQDSWLPTLQSLNKNNFLKKITVDMGAIPHVCAGADVMRPGITKIEEDIIENSPVLVVDEKYGKFLAVGIALFGSEEMRKMEKGKTVRTLHYVGDWTWNFGKAP